MVEARIEGELLLGDEILVLDDAGGERDARHLGDALRPDAGAVDEDLAADGAVIGDDADDAVAFEHDVGDEDPLLDLHAAGAGTGGIGGGEAIGIDIAVGGNVGGADDAFLLDEGEEFAGFAGAKAMAFEAEGIGQRHRPPDLGPPFRR